MQGKIIDISVGISADSLVYPGDPEPVLESVSSIKTDGYAVTRVSFGTHTGTHVDAPSHIIEDGLSVDRIPIESFVGDGIVLDLSFVDLEISGDDLTIAFERFAKREKCAANDTQVLLIKTRILADGNEERLSLSEQKCLLPDAGLWIIEHGFKTVGVDTLSVDASATLVNHSLFLEKGMIVVENLDLGAVVPGVYHFICLPIKLCGCEAAPARAILVEKGFFSSCR